MSGISVPYLYFIPGAFLCLFPMKNQLRFALWRTLLVLAVFFAASFSLAVSAAGRFSLDPGLMVFPLAGLFLAVYHLCLRVPFSKTLSVFSSVAALLSILSTYATCFDAVCNPSLAPASYTADYVFFLLALTCAAALVLALPLLRYGSRMIDRMDNPRVWFTMVPFSVLLLLINFSMRPVNYETFHVNGVLRSALRIATVLLLMWSMIHVLFYSVVMETLRTAEDRQKQEILSFRERQFNAQQRYVDATARERHDFRQSIRTLRELFDAGDYEALGRYLHEFEENQPLNEIQPFCKNHALNALLNYYVHMAVRDGIDTEVETSLPDRLPLPDVDLCRIVGNLFENAIAASARAGEKWIRLSLVVVNDSVLYIVVTNSFDGHVNFKDGRYLSTHHGGSGIGLGSVSSIAADLGGMAEFSHRDKAFYSNIAIPLPKEDGGK